MCKCPMCGSTKFDYKKDDNVRLAICRECGEDYIDSEISRKKNSKSTKIKKNSMYRIGRVR